MYSCLEGSKGGRRKQGNLEHRVVPNEALWNVGFRRTRIVLLNVFVHEDSVTNRQKLYTAITTYSWHCALKAAATEGDRQLKSAPDVSISRFMNRLNSCCLSATGRSQRAKHDRAA
jgi:hypothetical protein